MTTVSQPRLTASLLQQIRETFEHVPGLRLSLASAMALWHVDTLTCDVALRILVEEGFLTRAGGDGVVCAHVQERVFRFESRSSSTRGSAT